MSTRFLPYRFTLTRPRELHEYTDDDFIQLIELVEELGGSSALKSPPEVGEDERVTELVAQQSEPMLLKIRARRGGFRSLHTSPRRGRGAAPQKISTGDYKGTLKYGDEAKLRQTNNFYLRKKSGKLVVDFLDGLTKVGEFESTNPVQANEQARGVFKFGN